MGRASGPPAPPGPGSQGGRLRAALWTGNPLFIAGQVLAGPGGKQTGRSNLLVVIQAPSPLQRPLTGAAGKAEVCLQRLDLSPPSSAWKGQVWRWETPRAQSLSHKCLLVKKKTETMLIHYYQSIFFFKTITNQNLTKSPPSRFWSVHFRP